MNIEEWVDVKGFEGVYQISSHGRLKSFHKDKDGKILSLTNKKGDYLLVLLTNKENVKRIRIHRLVAEHFIGDIPKGYHVHHKDGNKQNNNVENLEIVLALKHYEISKKQNPSIVSGLINYNTKIKPKTIYQYDLKGNFIASYINSKEAEKATGVCSRNILQVARKEEFNKKLHLVRKQAGGYIWSFEKKEGVVSCS